MKRYFTAFLFTIAMTASAAKCLSEAHFIQRANTQTPYTTKQLRHLFSQQIPAKRIIDHINHPYEQKPWYVYRHALISHTRIIFGKIFMHEESQYLSKATQVYGVPQNIIAAIIGIESNYGRHYREYPEFNTLYTLAFYRKKDCAYFQHELLNWLILAHSWHTSPLSGKGSYAGALGWPQFMPSSIIHYGISIKPNRRWPNLADSTPESILSVGNYLHKHGWKRNSPIAVKIKSCAVAECQQLQALSNKALSRKQLNWLSRQYHQAFLHKGVMLRSFKSSPETMTYWLTLHNFSTLMHYNDSHKYAMAVYQLAEHLS